eukprot:RCo024226
MSCEPADPLDAEKSSSERRQLAVCLGNSLKNYDVDWSQAKGTGSFATVWKAKSRPLGVPVVLKIIDKQRVKGLGLQHRLSQEIELHSRLRHPAVVELLTWFQDSAFVYLVLEACEMEVAEYVRRAGPRPEPEAAHMTWKIVHGLLYLHRRNILHRDIKPSNTLITKEGFIKIADFGLATTLSPDFGMQTGTVCGTKDFMPPELLERKPYSFPADMWCLGCFVYFLLTAELPFRGDARTGSFSPSSKLSPAARDLVMKMLTEDAEQRITAAEVLQHPFLTQHVTLARPSSLDNAVRRAIDRRQGRDRQSSSHPSPVPGSPPHSRPSPGCPRSPEHLSGSAHRETEVAPLQRPQEPRQASQRTAQEGSSPLPQAQTSVEARPTPPEKVCLGGAAAGRRPQEAAPGGRQLLVPLDTSRLPPLSLSRGTVKLTLSNGDVYVEVPQGSYCIPRSGLELCDTPTNGATVRYSLQEVSVHPTLREKYLYACRLVGNVRSATKKVEARFRFCNCIVMEDGPSQPSAEVRFAAASAELRHGSTRLSWQRAPREVPSSLQLTFSRPKALVTVRLPASSSHAHPPYLLTAPSHRPPDCHGHPHNSGSNLCLPFPPLPSAMQGQAQPERDCEWSFPAVEGEGGTLAVVQAALRQWEAKLRSEGPCVGTALGWWQREAFVREVCDYAVEHLQATLELERNPAPAFTGGGFRVILSGAEGRYSHAPAELLPQLAATASLFPLVVESRSAPSTLPRSKARGPAADPTSKGDPGLSSGAGSAEEVNCTSLSFAGSSGSRASSSGLSCSFTSNAPVDVSRTSTFSTTKVELPSPRAPSKSLLLPCTGLSSSCLTEQNARRAAPSMELQAPPSGERFPSRAPFSVPAALPEPAGPAQVSSGEAQDLSNALRGPSQASSPARTDDGMPEMPRVCSPIPVSRPDPAGVLPSQSSERAGYACERLGFQEPPCASSSPCCDSRAPQAGTPAPEFRGLVQPVLCATLPSGSSVLTTSSPHCSTLETASQASSGGYLSQLLAQGPGTPPKPSRLSSLLYTQLSALRSGDKSSVAALAAEVHDEVAQLQARTQTLTQELRRGSSLPCTPCSSSCPSPFSSAHDGTRGRSLSMMEATTPWTSSPAVYSRANPHELFPTPWASVSEAHVDPSFVEPYGEASPARAPVIMGGGKSPASNLVSPAPRPPAAVRPPAVPRQKLTLSEYVSRETVQRLQR